MNNQTQTNKNGDVFPFYPVFQWTLPTAKELDKWEFLRSLAKDYDKACEEFDQKHCTGPNTEYGKMPANPREQAESNRYASRIFAECVAIVEDEGFSRQEFKDVLNNIKCKSRYRGTQS